MVTDPYQRFLTERLAALAVATERAADGRFRGRLVFEGTRGRVEAWRCHHRHASQGLAYSCAEAERRRLRSELARGVTPALRFVALGDLAPEAAPLASERD